MFVCFLLNFLTFVARFSYAPQVIKEFLKHFKAINE